MENRVASRFVEQVETKTPNVEVYFIKGFLYLRTCRFNETVATDYHLKAQSICHGLKQVTVKLWLFARL